MRCPGTAFRLEFISEIAHVPAGEIEREARGVDNPLADLLVQHVEYGACHVPDCRAANLLYVHLSLGHLVGQHLAVLGRSLAQVGEASQASFGARTVQPYRVTRMDE